MFLLVHCVEDKAGFFAERLRDSVACAGTKDRQLIRVVVSRCEIDMQNIKRAYQQRYGKSVEQDISVWIFILLFYLILNVLLLISKIIFCSVYLSTLRYYRDVSLLSVR